MRPGPGHRTPFFGIDVSPVWTPDGVAIGWSIIPRPYPQVSLPVDPLRVVRRRWYPLPPVPHRSSSTVPQPFRPAFVASFCSEFFNPEPPSP